MVHKALFADRSPPRFKRCRTVLPDDACNGLVPQSAASAASLFRRSGLSSATATDTAAVCGPTPNRSRSRLACWLVRLSSIVSSALSSSDSMSQRFASRRNVVVSVCNTGVLPSERRRAQPSTHSAVFAFRRRSRIPWGAPTSKARN